MLGPGKEIALQVSPSWEGVLPFVTLLIVSHSMPAVRCWGTGNSLEKGDAMSLSRQHAKPLADGCTSLGKAIQHHWPEVCITYSHYERKKGKVKVAQSCLTLCDPMDYTVHGILQARILECVDFPFSRGSSQPRDRTCLLHCR